MSLDSLFNTQSESSTFGASISLQRVVTYGVPSERAGISWVACAGQQLSSSVTKRQLAAQRLEVKWWATWILYSPTAICSGYDVDNRMDFGLEYPAPDNAT